jgi:hypothetical protein
MTEHKIFIIVSGKEDVSKLFQKVGSSSKELEKGSKGLGKAFGGLKDKTSSLIGPLAKLAGGAAILGVGKASVQASMSAERFRNSLEGLAGGAQEATSYIDAIQSASLGTISQLDAMAISSKALTLGVVDNAGAMADLTEIAITLGQAQGMTATQSVDDLTTALGRQSPLILDNLGITLKLSEAHQIYADQLGKDVSQLTEAEKGQAFLNAALIKGKEVASELGGVQLDNAAKSERLNAQMADMAITLGDSLVPVFTAFVGVASEALTAITPLLETFAEMTKGLDEMNAAIAETNTISASMGDQFAALVEGGTSTADALEQMAAKMDKANAASKNLSNAEKIALTVLGKTDDVTRTVDEAQDSLNRTLVKGADSYDAYLTKATEFNSLTKDSDSQLNVLGQTQFKYLQIQQQVNAQVDDSAEKWAYWEEQAKDSNLTAQEMMWTQLDLALKGESLASVTGKVTRESLGLTAATEQQIWAQERARQGAFDQAEAMENNAEYSAEFAEQQRLAGISADLVASAEERAAANAASLAEQQRAAAEAAANYATEQGNLMMALSGANEEQFKAKVFAAIDPAEIGVEAYAALGQELGVLDEKSADLAAAIPVLTQAYTDGIIPTENMAAVTTDLFNAAGDASFSMEELIGKYTEVPQVVGPGGDAIDAFSIKLDDMGGYVATATVELSALAAAYQATATAAGKLPAVPSAAAASPPSYQGGGVVPGQSYQAVPIVAHGGERVVPVGQSVGPYGPPMPASSVSVSNQFGGDTYILSDELSLAMRRDQQYRRRRARMEGRA